MTRRWRCDSGCWDLRLSAISTCATIKLSRCPRLTDWLVRPNLSQISPMFGYGDLMIASLEQWKENKGKMIRKGKAGKREEEGRKGCHIIPKTERSRTNLWKVDKYRDFSKRGKDEREDEQEKSGVSGNRAACAGIGQWEAFVYKPWNKRGRKRESMINIPLGCQRTDGQRKRKERELKRTERKKEGRAKKD